MFAVAGGPCRDELTRNGPRRRRPLGLEDLQHQHLAQPHPRHGIFPRPQRHHFEGDDFDFNQLKGKRVLIVNTASRCGYTPQYKPLEELHDMYKDQGLVHPGLPLQPVRKAGAWHLLRHSRVLFSELRRELPNDVQGGREGGRSTPGVRLADPKGPSTEPETTRCAGTFTSSWSTAKASWWPRSAAVPIRLETKSRRSHQANDPLPPRLQRSCKKGTPARAFFHGSVLHKRASFLGKLNLFRGAPSSRTF